MLGGFSGLVGACGGGERSEEALEFPDATEKTERREMLEERPERRSLEVWRADLRRVRRKPPPASLAVAVMSGGREQVG